ncbi:lethal (1) G0469 NlpC/P60 domain-containing protein [Musca autumnalis]|uniref:lethal (1) G0469 NlpC/P60 domain-containing protein n=1 Tax=Musca autumnalis TaxID=221902 RepID=UPI003CEA24A7
MTASAPVKINRSNSFVNSLKWWPLHSHQPTNGDGGGGGGGVAAAGFRGFIPFNKTHTQTTFGSSVAVQKLRESKWFTREEQRIFCAVVECGFIVELRSSAAVARKLAQQQQRRQRLLSLTNKIPATTSGYHQHSTTVSNGNYDATDAIQDLSGKCCSVAGTATPNNQQDTTRRIFTTSVSSSDYNNHHCDYTIADDDDYYDEDDLDMQDENDTPIPTWFGIVLCKTTKENKPKPETIEIFSVKIRENGTFKMLKMSLEDVWNNGWELRINNFADKEKSPHNEKDIRNQVSFARKAKQSLWNNNQHFVYWCRYGSRQQDVRKRQMSECVKWGSVGMNAGMLLLMNKKSYSTSK